MLSEQQEINQNKKIVPAFKVLTSTSDNTIEKPNAIVRPVPRTKEQFVDNDGGTKGTEISNLMENVESQIISDRKQTEKSKIGLFGKFTKELDSKLRQLQRDHAKNSSKNSSNGDIIQRRPLFVTTVPTGVYLQPVRELPIPPPKRTYAYYSIPKIFGYNKENNSSEGNVRSPTHATSKHHTKQMKLRDVQNSQNIMYDKRVIRGSNYGQSNLNNLWNPYFAYAGLLSGKVDTPPVNKDEENRRRRQLLRKRIATRNQRGIIGTPPPVKGRKHEDVQTEKYLEELYSRPPEMDVQCQTDLFLQRPPTPPYVPKKTGVDAVTEILEGELFHFDTEVEPLLKSLVSKSVEQGLMEVMHEEELAEIRKQQQEFLAIRESELAELRRLEAEELRLQTEKERRLKQEAVARAVDLDMNERITAAKLLQGHIANILPDVLRSIDPYKDAENRDALERELGPWLAAEVATEIGQMVDSRDLLEEIVREILEERAEKYLNMTDDTSSSDQFEDYEDSQVEENNSYFHLADDESETKSNL